MQESLDFRNLQSLYQSNPPALLQILKEIQIRINEYADPSVWISRVNWDSILLRAEKLLMAHQGPVGSKAHPLFGIPFAVKDNIDVEGMLTTAGCPAFAYTAQKSASVVTRLESAGAILIGKTNMDQFATGLVGTRSPFGEVRNAFNSSYISGGSSSGSAIAVAAGLVSFALGTDTAGSGRIPAGFNNIVGLKPTRGLISTTGVVPACRSLDCVSVFALTCEDAAKILELSAGVDERDAFSRSAPHSQTIPLSQSKSPNFRFGTPDKKHLEFFGDTEYSDLFQEACEKLESMGGLRIEIPFAPFAEGAALLYQGPWLAERQVAFGDFMQANPNAVLPILSEIMSRANSISAAEGFRAYYKLRALRAQVDATFQNMDFMVVPTAPTHYTIAEILADPIRLNSRLGYYTNFVNLFDLSALALPSSLRKNGIPFGITLIGKAFNDDHLSKLGQKFQVFNGHKGLKLGATHSPMPKENLPHDESSKMQEHHIPPIKKIKLAVAGLHLSGQPLNSQLTVLNAQLIGTFKTAPAYRFFAIAKPGKIIPGLVRQIIGGASIEIEVWELTEAAFGAFLTNVNAPLCIGSLELESGEKVKGFLCESYAIEGAQEITQCGSWRAFLGLG